MSKRITRREFIKGSAAAGVAVGLGLQAGPAVGRVLGANDRIAVGVIGCGGMGTNHLRGLVDRAGRPEYNLLVRAVCDIYEPRKARAKRISHAEVFHNYQDMLALEDLDAVVIATPDHWHAKMAMDAMEAGKDVYLEKPMTYTWREAKQVAEVAKRTKRVLQVGVQSCSDDRWWKAHDLIKSGAIGKVLWTQSSICRNSTEGEWNYPIDKDASPENLDWNAFLGSAPKRPFDPERFFRWRKYWDYSGGIATDLFHHNLGHLEIALGPEFPKRVMAGGGIYVQHDRDVPDTFHMIIDYPSDHTVVLMSSMANRNGVPEVIYGHEATMYFEDPGIVIRPEEEFKGSKQEMQVRPDDRPGHMDDFLRCIRTREQPTCNAETSYRIMTAIALGVESYRKGKVMFFDPERETVV